MYHFSPQTANRQQQVDACAACPADTVWRKTKRRNFISFVVYFRALQATDPSLWPKLTTYSLSFVVAGSVTCLYIDCFAMPVIRIYSRPPVSQGGLGLPQVLGQINHIRTDNCTCTLVHNSREKVPESTHVISNRAAWHISLRAPGAQSWGIKTLKSLPNIIENILVVDLSSFCLTSPKLWGTGHSYGQRQC